MDKSIRANERVLRMVGLLPGSDAEHREVFGREVGPQPELISRVFGEPYVLNGRTIIPVSRVRFFASGSQRSGASEGRQSKRRGKQFWNGGGLYGVSEPTALIEISENGSVKIESIPNVLPIALLAILGGAWDVYWVLRTVREWRRTPR